MIRADAIQLSADALVVLRHPRVEKSLQHTAKTAALKVLISAGGVRKADGSANWTASWARR